MFSLGNPLSLPTKLSRPPSLMDRARPWWSLSIWTKCRNSIWVSYEGI